MFLEESHSHGCTTPYTISGTLVPSSDPIPVDGVEFTVSLLSNTGSDLVSEISFEVSSSINGGVLRCSGLNATAVGSREVTLQEENSVGELVYSRPHPHTAEDLHWWWWW